jgi:uncharacterized protein
MYHLGKVVKQDYNKAFKHYEKALVKNIPMTQYNLGAMYAKGLGVKKNYKKASELYEKAAKQGYVLEPGALGTFYMIIDK